MPDLNAETSVFNLNNRGASASLTQARSTFYQVLENMNWSKDGNSPNLLRLNEPKVTNLANLPAGAVSANTKTYNAGEETITRLMDNPGELARDYSLKARPSLGSNALWLGYSTGAIYGNERSVASFDGNDRLANLGSINLPIQYNSVTNPDYRAGRYIYFTKNESELWLHWDGTEDGAFKALTLPGASILGVYNLNDQLILNTTQGIKAVELSFSRDPVRALIDGDYTAIKTLAREIGGEALAREVVLPTVNTTDWSLEGFRDYDGDGDADLFWNNVKTGQRAFWQMNGLSFERGVFTPSFDYTNWRVSSFGDFDRDGDQDILWQNQDGTMAVWEMQGLSFKSGSVLYKLSPKPLSLYDFGWYVSGIGDFNGDNTLEILWRSAEGVMATWEIKNFQISKVDYLGTNVPEGWSVRATMDFDGDRDTDILWENQSTGQLALWTLQAGKLQSGAFLPIGLGIGRETEQPGPGFRKTPGTGIPSQRYYASQQNQGYLYGEQYYGGQFDFDGDGIMDIWWRSNLTQNKEVWKLKKVGSTLSYDRTVLKDGASYAQAI